MRPLTAFLSKLIEEGGYRYLGGYLFPGAPTGPEPESITVGFQVYENSLDDKSLVDDIFVQIRSGHSILRIGFFQVFADKILLHIDGRTKAYLPADPELGRHILSDLKIATDFKLGNLGP